MQRIAFLIILFLVFILIFSCTGNYSKSVEKQEHVEIIHDSGSDIATVILSERAIERLDLTTDKVREINKPDQVEPIKVVPYSSILYFPKGETWVYRSTGDRSFKRFKVVVDYIEGDKAILKEGPEIGTIIVDQAVAELYGSEFELGH